MAFDTGPAYILILCFQVEVRVNCTSFGWEEEICVKKGVLWADVLPAHRLTTYAFMHVGLIHLIVNLAIITPLLDRFESEYGTLTTFALFTGRKYNKR